MAENKAEKKTPKNITNTWSKEKPKSVEEQESNPKLDDDEDYGFRQGQFDCVCKGPGQYWCHQCGGRK